MTKLKAKHPTAYHTATEKQLGERLPSADTHPFLLRVGKQIVVRERGNGQEVVAAYPTILGARRALTYVRKHLPTVKLAER